MPVPYLSFEDFKLIFRQARAILGPTSSGDSGVMAESFDCEPMRRSAGEGLFLYSLSRRLCLSFSLGVFRGGDFVQRMVCALRLLLE